MNVETSVMMQKMIYDYKKPVDKIAFIMHPLTKSEKGIPDKFNGIDIFTDPSCPLENIYLRDTHKP